VICSNICPDRLGHLAKDQLTPRCEAGSEPDLNPLNYPASADSAFDSVFAGVRLTLTGQAAATAAAMMEPDAIAPAPA
jgi:hypothetical protein